MLVRAAIRLNPQSAMRKLRHRLRCSNLEPRGPKDGREIGPPRSRRVPSAQCFRRDSETAVDM
eukprot:701306-Alexandrium_andersonii.AAC.1